MAGRGHLIAFAGIDGAGKTTQARRLTGWLAAQGRDTVLLPNRSLLPVRQLLDRLAADRGHPDHVAMLGADTARLVAAVLKWDGLRELPELLIRPGRVVVMDRALVSQVAAVRLTGGGNESLIRAIVDTVPAPDSTILLDLAPARAWERLERRGTGTETLDHLARLAAVYRDLPEAAGFTRVDADPDPDTVQAAVRRAATAALATDGGPG